MLAAARGVNTINLVRSSDAIKELDALGIKNNINVEDDDWKEQVRQIIGDDSISAAVDSVGGEASGDSSAFANLAAYSYAAVQLTTIAPSMAAAQAW